MGLLTVAAATLVWSDDDEHAIALAVDSQQRLALGLSRQFVEVSHVAHGLAVDAFNNIAFLQAELRRRTIRIDLRNNDAIDIGGDSILIAKRRRKVRHFDAAQGPFLDASAHTDVCS